MSNLNSYPILKKELPKKGLVAINIQSQYGESYHLLYKDGKFAEKKTANVAACFLKYAIGLASVKKMVNNAYWCGLSTREFSPAL